MMPLFHLSFRPQAASVARVSVQEIWYEMSLVIQVMLHVTCKQGRQVHLVGGLKLGQLFIVTLGHVGV